MKLTVDVRRFVSAMRRKNLFPSERVLRDNIARIEAARTGFMGTNVGKLERETGELRKAVAALNGSSLWLDNNRPWRIMLTDGNWHLAVAEQYSDDNPEDGRWQDGKAICDIVNAAIKLCGAKTATAPDHWRSIASAPLDGSHVLLGRPKMKPVRGFYAYDSWWLHGWGAGQGRSIQLGGSHLPTHWMPLPATDDLSVGSIVGIDPPDA